jgi:phosphatidylserine/phosphatidylglycerophosphate/cardiolipin synthase-like enzyme
MQGDETASIPEAQDRVDLQKGQQMEFDFIAKSLPPRLAAEENHAEKTAGNAGSGQPEPHDQAGTRAEEEPPLNSLFKRLPKQMEDEILAERVQAYKVPFDANGLEDESLKTCPIRLTTKNNLVTPYIDGPDIHEATGKMIDAAEKSILLEMYDFADFGFAEKLVGQAKKGLDVKVLLDPAQAEGKSASEARTKVLNYLVENQIPVLLYPANVGSRQLDHCKLMIVDGKSVMLGSMNWNPASLDNHEMNVRIDGPAAEYFGYHFVDGWKSAGGEDIPIPTPDKHPGGHSQIKGFRTEGRMDGSAEDAILNAIQKANSSIFAEMYVLSNQEIIQGFIDAHKRGVDVRVLLDPTNQSTGWNPNSESFKKLKKAGVPVRWYKVDPGSKMHTKMALIDKEKLLIGSVNWSHKGMKANREIGAEIDCRDTGEIFHQQFYYDWRYKSSETDPT